MERNLTVMKWISYGLFILAGLQLLGAIGNIMHRHRVEIDRTEYPCTPVCRKPSAS